MGTEMIYYKFRTLTQALRDISEKRLRISRYLELNDPYELMAIASTRSTFIEGLSQIVKIFNDKWGITCFSGKWQDPVMWSHYSDDHKGISLGFIFPTLVPDKVEYAEKPFTELEWLKMYHANPHTAIRAWFLRKYSSWQYEDEYRFISGLKDPDPVLTGMYFVDFGPTTMELKEVIIGARCTETMSSIRKTLNAVGLYRVKIVKAVPSTNDFKIVAGKISGA
jgi:hypothetical protein